MFEVVLNVFWGVYVVLSAFQGALGSSTTQHADPPAIHRTFCTFFSSEVEARVDAVQYAQERDFQPIRAAVA